MPDQFLSDTLINTLLVIAQIALVYLGIFWLCVVYWAYRDARSRRSNPAYAVAAAALVLFFLVPGYWLYLVTRPRLTMSEVAEERVRQFLVSEYLRQCPACSTTVTGEYVVCPRCRTRLKATCASCTKPVEPTWVACAYCANVISIEQPTSTTVVADIPAREPVHA